MTKSKYTRVDYTVAQIAYLAGLIDGEGALFIGNYGNKDKIRGTGFFQTIMGITSTDKCLIDWLYDNFGGWASEYTPKQLAKNARAKAYSWRCTGDRLTHLCELILPYLIIKKQQAQILLEMRSTYFSSEYQIGKQGVQPISKEIVNKRLDLMNQLKSIHCRNYAIKKD